MDKVYLTSRGAEALREELKNLKTVVRPKIVHDIAVAREHGDLKENAEYHAAREQQGFCEGRIKDIEGKLGNATIIDSTISGNTSTKWHGGALFATDGTVSILNSTIVNNSAPGGTAGGLMVATFGAPVAVTLQNTIVANNSGGPHCLAEGTTVNHILGMEVVLAGGVHLKARPDVGDDLFGV